MPLVIVIIKDGDNGKAEIAWLMIKKRKDKHCIQMIDDWLLIVAVALEIGKLEIGEQQDPRDPRSWMLDAR